VDFPAGTEVVSLEPGDILRSPKNLSTSMLLYPQVNDFTFVYGYKTNSLIPGGNDMLAMFSAFVASPYLLPAAAILLVILLVIIYVFVVRRRLKRIEKSIEEQKKVEGVKDEANLDVHERIEKRMDEQMKAEEVKDEVKDVISGPEEVHDTSTEVSHIEEVTLAVGSKGRKIDSSVLNMLDENERKVVELIENADGEITQAYIYKSTSIPKASLSDLIKRLEKRNIIERRRDGRTNWINLQEWVFSE
jgi:membrane protein implicated in regulation of membrane protease activity